MNNSKFYTTFNIEEIEELIKDKSFENPIFDIGVPRSINENGVFDNSYRHKYWTILKDTESGGKIDEKVIEYKSPTYYYGEEEVIFFHNFYVKLKDNTDRELLFEIAKEYNVQVLGRDHYMPLWYELSINKNSHGTTLEIVNKFYESGKFAYAEPNIMVKFDLDCVSEPLFTQQWYLKNTGQNGGTPGMDIAVCEAWEITKGCSDVVVAVIDHGLEYRF